MLAQTYKASTWEAKTGVCEPETAMGPLASGGQPMCRKTLSLNKDHFPVLPVLRIAARNFGSSLYPVLRCPSVLSNP